MDILRGLLNSIEEGKDFISALGVFFTLVLGIISFIIAKKLYQIENKRDAKMIKDNAVVVYYDLLLGLMDIIRLSHPELNIKPKKLYFNENWIKDVSYLRVKLGANIDRVYLLYGDMITARELLDSKDGRDLEDVLKKIRNEVFINPSTIHLDYLDGNLAHLETLLRWDYLEILEDIRTTYENNVVTLEDKRKFKKAQKRQNRKQVKSRNIPVNYT